MSDHNKRILDFLFSSQYKQFGEVQMSRSEFNLRGFRELRTEMKTEFAPDRGRNFHIGSWDQPYSLLDIELKKKACPQVISANTD